jgi:hypothetical protein
MRTFELVNTDNPMPEATAPKALSDADQLDAAADQAIAACGGDARETVKALLVANEFLESQISQGYLRGVKHGRFNTCSG